MTHGAVDLKIVTERLEIVTSAVAELRALPAPDLETFTSDRRNIWAADALLRRAIEGLFDTARHLLARAHGRGGLEYREVARLAAQHGLVPPGLPTDALLKVAGFRNRLTHHYGDVTPDEIFAVITNRLRDLEEIAGHLSASAAQLAAARPPDSDSPTGPASGPVR